MKKISTLISLSLVPFLLVLGNSMLIPVFPLFQSKMHITNFQVRLLITLFSFPAAVAIPFVGFLSDKVGRKVVIVPSVIIYGLCGLAAGLAATFMKRPFTLILVFRVIQGISGAGTAYIAMALAGDIFKSGKRSNAMGSLEAANGMGKVLSPILGTLFAAISWYFLFYAYAIISIPVAICVLIFVKEVKNNAQEGIKEYLSGIAGIFKKKGLSIAACLVFGLIVFFALFGVLSYMSDIFEDKYGFKGILKGILISIPVLTMCITSFSMGLYLKKVKKYFKLSILTGGVILTVSYVLLIFFTNKYGLLVILGISGIGIGAALTSLNTMVTSCAEMKMRGAVTSLYGSIRFFGVAIGPIIFSVLAKMGNLIVFIIPAVLVGAITVVSIFLINEKDMLEFNEA